MASPFIVKLREKQNKLHIVLRRYDERYKLLITLLAVLEFAPVLPGIALVICSGCMLLFPGAWYPILMVFLLCLGLSLTVMAFQFVFFKWRFFKLVSALKGSVMIQSGTALTEEQFMNLIESAGTKITMH